MTQNQSSLGKAEDVIRYHNALIDQNQKYKKSRDRNRKRVDKLIEDVKDLEDSRKRNRKRVK